MKAVSVLLPFACPVCGAIRSVSPRALRTIELGARTGECVPGQGCRSNVPAEERLRRWWLINAGVSEQTIRRAGGAMPYVAEFGLPDRLWRVGCAASDIPDVYFSRALQAAA